MSAPFQYQPCDFMVLLIRSIYKASQIPQPRLDAAGVTAGRRRRAGFERLLVASKGDGW
jgi:hypothetical protein